VVRAGHSLTVFLHNSGNLVPRKWHTRRPAVAPDRKDYGTRGMPSFYEWWRGTLIGLGFVDFFGDLGGGGELGAVPAAAEGFD